MNHSSQFSIVPFVQVNHSQVQEKTNRPTAPWQLVTLVASVLLVMASTSILAGDVPAGSTKLLHGTTSAANPNLGGRVIRDSVEQFEIRDSSGNSIMKGELQDRVVKSRNLNTLIFSYRLRKLSGSSDARIVGVKRDGFRDAATDIDYRRDGLGDIGPSSVKRSSNGDKLEFSYEGSAITPTNEGYFTGVVSDARDYVIKGSITIYARASSRGPVFSTKLTKAAIPKSEVGGEGTRNFPVREVTDWQGTENPGSLNEEILKLLDLRFAANTMTWRSDGNRLTFKFEFPEDSTCQFHDGENVYTLKPSRKSVRLVWNRVPADFVALLTATGINKSVVCFDQDGSIRTFSLGDERTTFEWVSHTAAENGLLLAKVRRQSELERGTSVEAHFRSYRRSKKRPSDPYQTYTPLPPLTDPPPTDPPPNPPMTIEALRPGIVAAVYSWPTIAGGSPEGLLSQAREWFDSLDWWDGFLRDEEDDDDEENENEDVAN